MGLWSKGVNSSTSTVEDTDELPQLDEFFVPDPMPPHDDRQFLQQQFRHQNTSSPPAPFSMATLHSRAVDEFDSSLHTARAALPFLFPTDQASFTKSRLREVGRDAYYLHLMRYKDGRFASHPKFRYWILNTKLRHQSERSSHWMWKKSSDKDITFDISEELLDNPDLRLSEIIARRVSNLRDTRPYQIDKSKQLDAIIRSRALPAMFCTLSAADHHWPDLFEHMPSKDDYFNAATENQRMQIALQQVQENPHIIHEYLTMRFQTFYEELLKPKFNTNNAPFLF